jgi:hypothetical protein
VEGLDGVQRLARTCDDDLLDIYAEMLDESGLYLAAKDCLQAEAWEEYRHFLGSTLVVSRLDVVRESEDEEGTDLIELDPPMHVRVAPSPVDEVRLRWLLQGEKYPHYLDPLWRVESLDHGTPFDRPELEGVTEAWVHGPTIWLSGKVEWFPEDWLPAAAQGEKSEALVVRDYMEHRGKVLLAGVLHGYGRRDDSNEWRFEPPVRVRVEPTDLQSIGHSNDEWSDPYWDVQIVGHPLTYSVSSLAPNVTWRETEREPDTLRSIWIDGISRSETGEIQHADWTVEPEPEVL